MGKKSKKRQRTDVGANGACACPRCGTQLSLVLSLMPLEAAKPKDEWPPDPIPDDLAELVRPSAR